MARNARIGFRIPRHVPVRHALGLDISDVRLELMELTRVRGGVALAAFSHMDLPADTVRDGEVLEPARLSGLLQQAFREARPRPFRTRAVLVALPESRVYLRPFEFPRTLTVEQVRRATPYEAEGVLPLTLDEMTTDVLFHRSRADTHHVLFAATPQKIAGAYEHVLRAAGLEPVAFDVESAALARSIVGDLPEPVLVADIGGRATVMSVVEREAVHSAVTLPIAGDAFTQHIADTLGIPQGEAEELKRRVGMTAAVPAGVREALRESILPLVQELRRTAEYHAAHTGRGVGALLLAGGSAQLPGLADELSQAVRLPTRPGDPWQTKGIRLPTTLAPADREALLVSPGAFATVVGLALRGVEREPAAAGINLLPLPARLPHLRWRATLASSGLAGVTACVLLGLTTILSASALGRWYESRHVAAEAARVRTELFGARFQEAVREATAVNQELDVLERFAADIPDMERVVRTLQSLVPPGVRLQAMESRVPPADAEPISVKLSGTADRRETFLEFERRLRDLDGVSAFSSPLTNLNLRENVPFALSFGLKRAGVSPVP